MQFFTIASLFAATALAAPSCAAPHPDTETASITRYTLRKNNGIKSVSFKLTSGDVTVDCSIGVVPALPSEVVGCGNSAYSFGLTAPVGDFSDASVIIYHQTGEA